MSSDNPTIAMLDGIFESIEQDKTAGSLRREDVAQAVNRVLGASEDDEAGGRLIRSIENAAMFFSRFADEADILGLTLLTGLRIGDKLGYARGLEAAGVTDAE